MLIRCVFMNPYWASEAIREAMVPQFAATIRQALTTLD